MTTWNTTIFLVKGIIKSTAGITAILSALFIQLADDKSCSTRLSPLVLFAITFCIYASDLWDAFQQRLKNYPSAPLIQIYPFRRGSEKKLVDKIHDCLTPTGQILLFVTCLNTVYQQRRWQGLPIILVNLALLIEEVFGLRDSKARKFSSQKPSTHVQEKGGIVTQDDSPTDSSQQVDL
ncbi:hypothetical protein F5Y08DRAFT_320572 [Xylaria arbuscula]|nr:hypothetical protein F5Y08DRAFT_320572 [Xylaria arbuscula]